MPFEDIAPRFWKPDSDYLVQEPLTDEALRAKEEEFGVRLPEEYVALLRIQNGGVVSKECNACPTADDYVQFGDMMGIGPEFMTIRDSSYLEEEEGITGQVVLLTGDGHWWIALDYRESEDPSVAWLDTELGKEFQLAPSFRAFVEGLVPEEQFTGPPPDMDEPPPRKKQGESSIGGVVMSIGQDIELFEEGRRSLDNTRLWPRFRCQEVLGHMWLWQTRRLKAALREVEAAQTPEELVSRMRAIEPELDRLLPAWIRKRRAGYLSDEKRLRELRKR
ncbi:MAG TPA: SMI1/KNR4 family protein [Solirubrobacteraceae bacterium]|nr:SMI1/KNR4 family protein [Solirubrobacteraceae bacterium]